MPQASKRISRIEFDPLKEAVERVLIRVEVQSHDLQKLNCQVADRFERRLARVELRLDVLEQRVDGLYGRIGLMQETLLLAIKQIAH